MTQTRFEHLMNKYWTWTTWSTEHAMHMLAKLLRYVSNMWWICK